MAAVPAGQLSVQRLGDLMSAPEPCSIIPSRLSEQLIEIEDIGRGIGVGSFPQSAALYPLWLTQTDNGGLEISVCAV